MVSRDSRVKLRQLMVSRDSRVKLRQLMVSRDSRATFETIDGKHPHYCSLGK